MSIQKIHLNKLLKIMYLPEKALITALRQDIREELQKQNGGSSGGGNFYAPFWHDAKLHISGDGDIAILTDQRIRKNGRRKNLYPRLRDGLMDMWTRGDNQKVELLEINPKTHLEISSLGLTVKIDNFMGVSIDGKERLVYPYWFPDPKLSEEAARLGVHIMQQAFGDEVASKIRIYDVMRSQYFSMQDNPLQHDETLLLHNKYKAVLKLREKLREEY